MGKLCDECAYSCCIDYGYSNWTVEGTTVYCLLDLNPELPEDRFYGEEPALKFADTCDKFKAGGCIDVDVDAPEDWTSTYSDDPELLRLLKRFD